MAMTLRFMCKTLLNNYKTSVSSSSSSSSTLLSIYYNCTTAYVDASAGDSNPTISYLKDVCGLPLKTAVRCSEHVTIHNTTKADSVLQLFKSHGFTDAHIVKLLTSYPRVLISDPVNNLRPKIEYFESLGTQRADLHKNLCYNSWILSSSLKNKIIPTINFLKKFLQTDEHLVLVLKKSLRLVGCSVEKVIAPNISTLCAHGVSDSLIKKLMLVDPRPLTRRVDVFEEGVKRVLELGVKPVDSKFILAISCVHLLSKKKWEKKMELLMSFGWSQEEFLLAFRKQPMMMMFCEKKIAETMGILLNRLKMSPSEIAEHPNVFLIGLKNKVIPRCAVLQVLMLKGLITKNNTSLAWALCCRDNIFERRYLTRFKEVVPDIIKAYQGKLEVEGFFGNK